MPTRPQLNWRASAVTVAAVAVIVAVVVGVLGGGGEPSPSSGDPASAGEDSPTESPRGARGSGQSPRRAAGGFSRDEAGAVSAALAYASAPQRWLYLSDDALRGDATEVVVAGRAGEALVDEVVYDVGLLRDELEKAVGTVWFVVAPLATKLQRYSDTRATVAVWFVGVLSADDVAMPHSGWHTVTFDLEWHDTWLIAARRETEGPVPQLDAGQQPWSARYLAEELAGFHRVGET